MKIYTLEEYAEFYSDDTLRYICISTQQKNPPVGQFLPLCHCVTTFASHEQKTYKDCDFCCGRGIESIPWTELR